MEPTAQGHSEKSFSYVIRAPSSDGFDVMNVDVTIDTRWVFQDVEQAGEEEQGCLPERASSSPGATPGELLEQLESSERKLLTAVDEYVLSEPDLRARVRELELSERRLLWKVDQLGACAARERSVSLCVQEQLRVLREELASRAKEEERATRRLRRLRGQLRLKDEALGRQAAALERRRRSQRHQLGLVREQERVLRAQVRQLEHEVRRLCRAVALLLTQLEAAPPGCRPPAAPARRPQEQRAAERRLRARLEELRCHVYGLELSEIGLQSRVEELTEQNQRLRAQLGAPAPAGHGSLGAPSCVRSDVSSLPRMEAPSPCTSQSHHEDARVRQASTGRCLEEPRRAAPAVGAEDKLPGDLAGPSRGQVAPAQPCPEGQTLLLRCGCPPGQCEAELPLRPVSAGPFLLDHTSTVPFWGWAGDPESLPSLLPQDPSLELQTPAMLDTRPSPGPGVEAQEGWGCHGARNQEDASPYQETPHAESPLLPRAGSGAGTRRGGGQTERAEARGTSDVAEVELGDKRPSGTEVRAPDGVQEQRGALEAGAPTPRGGRLRMEGRGRGLLGGLPARKEATGPAGPRGARGPGTSRSARDHLPAGRGPAVGRSAGSTESHRLRFGEALLPQEGNHGGRGQEEEGERAPPPEAAQGPAGQGTRPGSPCLSRWTAAAEGGQDPCPLQGLSPGRDEGALQIAAFEKEMEMCFQQLDRLGLSRTGWQMARWAGPPLSSGQEGARPPQGLGACSAGRTKPREHGEGVSLGKTPALSPGEALPVPDGRDATGGLAELGTSPLSPHPLWEALERARGRFHQLLAALEGERSQLLRENAKLREDRARSHREARDLERERVRDAARIGCLERAKGELRAQLEQCLQAIAHLEDCNGKNHSKMSELEEENERLRRDLGRLHKALSESLRRGRDGMDRASQENAELRGLVRELGVSHKELLKDLVLGIEDMIRTLKGEIEHLLRRVQALERHAASQVKQEDRGAGRQHAPGVTQMARAKLRSADQAVPVPGLSRPPLEEDVALTRGEPSLDLQSSSLGTPPTAPPPSGRRDAAAPSAPRGSIAAWEEDGCLVDQGQAPRLHAWSAQLRDPEVWEAEDDPWLCALRLHQQVQTLHCQLRDQGSALLELQAARDRALRGQEELQATLEQLQKEQHDTRLAMSPLKAKLASLVRKCWERDHLIAHLLQELGRHGPVSPLLSERAQNMVHDEALAAYAATFLPRAGPEMSLRLEVSSEGTVAGGGQCCSQDQAAEVRLALNFSPLISTSQMTGTRLVLPHSVPRCPQTTILPSPPPAWLGFAERTATLDPGPFTLRPRGLGASVDPWEEPVLGSPPRLESRPPPEAEPAARAAQPDPPQETRQPGRPVVLGISQPPEWPAGQRWPCDTASPRRAR